MDPRLAIKLLERISDIPMEQPGSLPEEWFVGLVGSTGCRPLEAMQTRCAKCSAKLAIVTVSCNNGSYCQKCEPCKHPTAKYTPINLVAKMLAKSQNEIGLPPFSYKEQASSAGLEFLTLVQPKLTE